MQEGLFSYEKNKKNFASIMKKGKYCKKSSPDGVCNPVRNISGSNVFLWFPIMNADKRRWDHQRSYLRSVRIKGKD